jgi:hypothetical protein
VEGQYRSLLSKLALPHHAGAAFRALQGAGLAALPAVREGLRHANGDVRLRCCQFLDRHLMPEAMDDLVDMLDDPDERVRCIVLHVLNCDRCKEGSCRPDEAKVLPRALALLAGDPDPHVRAHAVGLVGRWVHTSPAAEPALLRALQSDSSPAVRKKAGWYVPGGTIHRKTARKAARTERRRASA